jgi:hypothetical protein
MAWTATSTKTTGTLVTAAIWNEQVAANMTFLGASHDHSGHPGDGATIAGGAPSGLILPSDVACPAGWTRFSALDNKMIRAFATYGGTGGADTHVHAGPSHTHGVGSHSHTGVAHTHTGPSHYHSQNSPGDTAADDTAAGSGMWAATRAGSVIYMCGAGAASGSYMGAGTANDGTGATSSANADTASATGTTNAGGTGNTNSGNTLPPYAGIIFCKKD